MTGATPNRGRRPAHGEPVLDRAFRILAAFGPDSRSLSLTSLSVRAGLPKASAPRIARKLVEWGALERAEDGDYVIGLRLLEVASLAPRGHGLRATALPYLEDLHHATGQHVLLAVRDGHEAVLVERLSAEPESTRLSSRDLRARLAAVRRDGVAVVSRPQPEPMTSVACPVIGRHRAPVAALAVVARSGEVEPVALTPAVVAVARAITRAMAGPEQRSDGMSPSVRA